MIAIGLLEFEGGVVATVEATTAAALEILGDQGTGTVSGSWGHLELRLRQGKTTAETHARPTESHVETGRAHPAVEPYAEQIKDFVTAIRGAL